MTDRSDTKDQDAFAATLAWLLISTAIPFAAGALTAHLLNWPSVGTWGLAAVLWAMTAMTVR